MSGFQSTVTTQPAPGVAGDFCDANPRYSVDFGPGGAVAGALGATVGAFAWAQQGYPLDPNSAPAVVNNFGTGSVTGFVGRAQQALITAYLGVATQLIPVGFPVTLFSGGGFFVVNSGATEVAIGQKAYANYSNGLATFAATGSPTTGPSATSTIAAGTGSFTGSITDNLLTITAVGSGTAVVGGLLTGSGVASGTRITYQVSGTAGGVGVYGVSIPEQDVASTTISETYGLLTAGTTTGGSWTVGTVVSGSTTSASTIITALGTGVGGAGTYIVNNTQTVGSATLTGTTNVETKWVAMSAGAPGELIKISSQPLG